MEQKIKKSYQVRAQSFEPTTTVTALAGEFDINWI
jgi:hypothetical protein